MPILEAGTVTVTVTALSDQEVPMVTLTPSPMEDDSFPPLPLSPVIFPEARANGSLKSSILTECTQDDFTDSEQYPQDGLLARANTVTSYGKPEAVFECLDVAAIMSRLQKDLREEEMLEREYTDEEGLDEREDEMKEERMEKEKIWMRSGEKAVDEDEKPVSTNVNPGTLDPKQSGPEPKPEIKQSFDANTHTIASGKGKGLAAEPSPKLEESHKLAIIPKFERGIGPAPGEAKYTSKKIRSKKNSGFRLFGFGSSSHGAGDDGAKNAPGPVQQKLTEDKKQEEKMKAFLKNEYVAKKAALSKARFQLSEATANVSIFEKSIESIEKQMLSKGVQIPSDEENKRTKTSG